MRKNAYTNIALFTVIVLAVVTGAYSLLRSPAPKPSPGGPVPAPFAAPQPIPGVPQFDAGKYKNEPVVTLWRADKGGGSEQLPLEQYLEGVISQEMDPSWPIEALKAQAIASRTLTINAIEAGTIRRLHNTDVSTAKEELQAYAPQKINDNIREAVRATRGQILLYAGSLVNAIYHDSNGQIGATREESFPREIPHPTPYFQPVTDSSYRFTPPETQYWTVTIPGREVAAAVGHDGNPGDITILEKGPSGRILSIGTASKKIYGADFRKAIGYDRLKSTLIDDMTYDGSRFTFKGRGWGNGAGLCQWGAYTYAQDGWNAEDILKHYYVGANIQKIWD